MLYSFWCVLFFFLSWNLFVFFPQQGWTLCLFCLINNGNFLFCLKLFAVFFSFFTICSFPLYRENRSNFPASSSFLLQELFWVKLIFYLNLDNQYQNHFNFVTTAGISQTTGNNASSGGSNATSSMGSEITAHSRFSAGSDDEEFPDGQILPTPNLRIFSFAELKIATRNFRPDILLGEGGFGKVYKGWLDEKAPGRIGSGTVIAVKRLNSESSQGFEEWQVLNPT